MQIIVVMIATMAIFLLGILIGYRLGTGKKPIETPKFEEVKEKIKSKEPKLTKKETKELENLNTIIKNIDAYEGTGKGQVVLNEK